MRILALTLAGFFVAGISFGYAIAQNVPGVNTAIPNCSHGAQLFADASTGMTCAPGMRTIGSGALQLPSCSASLKGQSFLVSDALLPSILATVAGGGAVMVRVTCDGTNWKVL